MGTSNFYWRNASECFAIIAKDYYNEDGDLLDEWEEGCETVDRTEDEIDFIKESLKASGWNMEDKRVPQDWNSKIIATKNAYFPIGRNMEDLAIEMQIVLRFGYYEGATLDWELNIENGSYDSETDPEDIAGDMLYYSDWNEGIKAMNRAKVVKRIEAAIKKAGEECDETCREHCTNRLRVSARFSNGETWYEEIK